MLGDNQGTPCSHPSSIEFRDLTTSEGISRVQEFIQSLNIYGNTPFLYPIYGGGDILQSFCRINNVYAGITMLQTAILSLITDAANEKILGLEIANEATHTIIRCKHIIAADEYPFPPIVKPTQTVETVEGKLAHGLYIVKGNNKGVGNDENSGVFGESKANEKDLRELVVVPACEEHRAIYLLIVVAHRDVNCSLIASSKSRRRTRI